MSIGNRNMIFDYFLHRYIKKLDRIKIGCFFFFISVLTISFVNNPVIKAFHLQGYAQGTSYHIVYYSADSLISQRSVDSLLTAIDSSLSLYKPYSTINEFNASSHGVLMDGHMKKVVEKSIEIYKETNGLFDITVQPLVEAWGFGVRNVESLPDSNKIKELLKCVGTGKLHIKDDSLYKNVPCLHLDLNGIAQGYSVDVIANFFRKNSIDNFLIELGGELVVSGRKPRGEMMNVAIEAPRYEGFGLSAFQKILHLDYGGLTTSGNYRKFYESSSRKINHLINPFTGYSFQNELISVTVWAKDAITADGYDNALMGMGLKKALQFIQTKKDIEAYFIYRQQDGTIKDTSTKGFQVLFNKR
jgi:FAD:protein FMN transferase